MEIIHIVALCAFLIIAICIIIWILWRTIKHWIDEYQRRKETIIVEDLLSSSMFSSDSDDSGDDNNDGAKKTRNTSKNDLHETIVIDSGEEREMLNQIKNVVNKNLINENH